jgi:hypothetical protein
MPYTDRTNKIILEPKTQPHDLTLEIVSVPSLRCCGDQLPAHAAPAPSALVPAAEARQPRLASAAARGTPKTQPENKTKTMAWLGGGKITN